MSRTSKKPYTGSKRFDTTCRCHGGCSYCYSNRMYNTIKKIYLLSIDVKENNVDKYYKKK